MVIVEKKFVWLHFGKTAGTSCREGLLKLFPDAFYFPDNDPRKHGNLADARDLGIEIPEYLTVVVGFRKLASWLDSHLREQFGACIPDDVRQQSLDGKLVLAPHSKAREIGLFKGVDTLDDLIRYYCSEREVIFIRNEYLAKDFARFLGLRFEELSKESIKKTFQSRRNVKKHLGSSRFTHEELARLSEACPLWTALEKKLYNRSIFNRYRNAPVKI